VEQLREQAVEVGAMQLRAFDWEPLPKRTKRGRTRPTYYNPEEINNSQQLGSRTGVGRIQAAPIIIELSGDSDDNTTELQPTATTCQQDGISGCRFYQYLNCEVCTVAKNTNMGCVLCESYFVF
jgi:hypothetical protein